MQPMTKIQPQLHEAASVRVPTAAWRPLRDALATAANSHAEQVFNLASQVYVRIKDSGAAGFGLPNQLALALQDHGVVPGGFLGQGATELLTGPDYRLRRPLRCQMPCVSRTRVSELAIGARAMICLDSSAQTVNWSASGQEVDVLIARQHPVAQELFRRLHSIAWSGRSGGQLVRNGRPVAAWGPMQHRPLSGVALA